MKASFSSLALGSLLAFSLVLPAQAESIQYAKRIVGTLASPEYWGRGYTKDGMKKAADFIASELASAGVAPLNGTSYFQNFDLGVNTFPGEMSVTLNGKKLVPGVDYIVNEESNGARASGDLVMKDPNHYTDVAGRVLFSFEKKLTWSVGRKILPTTEIILDPVKFTEKPQHFSINIENTFAPAFHAQNLAAVVKGTVKPDSYLVFSAHYDHLGGMGRDTFFPGANDNASGDAVVLGIARYFAAHPPAESVIFLFFGGEEAGLVGSKYFVDHPLVDLKQIHFLFNYDMEGTGVTGATVVNSTVYANEFAILQAVNAEGNYLPKIYPRGKAPNSDHYWFSEKGVPAFFMYTMGGIAAYHDVFDRPETLPLDHYEGVVELGQKFALKLMQ